MQSNRCADAICSFTQEARSFTYYSMNLGNKILKT